MSRITLGNDVDPRTVIRFHRADAGSRVLERVLLGRAVLNPIQQQVADPVFDEVAVIEDVPVETVEQFKRSIENEKMEWNGINAVQAEDRVVQTTNLQPPTQTPSYQTSMVMFNGTQLPVITQDRLGLKVRHKPNNPRMRLHLDVIPGEFVVRV
jgi:hypothetical protein